ncbi:MAG TPA: PIG-L family deacetylase [Candidatus Limnocylindrales bacterium]
MNHVFLSPHPDDIALSCGGLIALLRDAGDDVTIVTLFSGAGSAVRLTRYQQRALGFDRDADERGDPEPTEPDEANAPASASAPIPERVMAARRQEDEAYARFVGAGLANLRLADAVFRGYIGGPQLFGAPRPNDPAPVEELRAALADLTVDMLYIPLAIGGHVDHRQTCRAAIALLNESGSPYADRATFFEDFPYALTVRFEDLNELDPAILSSLPPDTSLTPEYIEVGTSLDRKIDGLRAYETQIAHLFGEDGESVADAIRTQTTRIGELGGVGPAERYWQVGGTADSRSSAARPPRRAT